MPKKVHLKELFRNFAGKEPEPEADGVTENPTQEETQEAAPELAAEPAPPDDGPYLLQPGDELRQIWQKWSGTQELPALSVTEGLHFEEWCADRERLEREAESLGAQLEQDALKRLQEIQVAEIRNLEYLNAKCTVYVSKDKMVAWLFLFPPVGEDGSLLPDTVADALKAAKVTAGLDDGAVMRAQQEQAYCRLIPVAAGTLPVEGTDGRVIDRFPQMEQPKGVEFDEKGIADFKGTHNARQVRKGDVICDIVPSVPGTAGQRVDGAAAEPRRVKNAKPPRGANTVLTEDGRQLIAAIDGHLEYDNGAFQVRPVLVVEGDVDYNVGNIDFKGDVQIRGDVRESFTVLATGSIVVEGHVEAATVEAGGDLTISRGAVGDFHARLKCGGCLRSKYLENCTVYAWKGVVSECIINSKVYSDTSIVVTGGRGSIVGGELKAAQSIKATVIGTEAGKRMELTLGVLPCAQEELERIRAQREEIDKENAKLDKLLLHAGDREDAKTAQAQMRKSALELQEQELQERGDYLEALTADPSQCRLEGGTVYPITVVTVESASLVVRDTTKQFRVKYNEETKELVTV